MKLKSFNQYLTESNNSTEYFQPHYFTLPYSIPEDRFEGGLLKSNTARKTRNRRLFSEDKAQYSSLDEFLEKNPIGKIEKSIMTEINKVIKFINNNKLTGKLLAAEFNQEMDFSEYLHEILENPNEDIPLGIIETDLPFSTFSIRVDYDIYKNIPVFTFWYDGDIFYYYGIFTLESNDVLGSGEFHTYITSTELIDYLFYETVWRAAVFELTYLNIEPDLINISDLDFDELSEIADDPNYSNQIVKDYFNKNFIKLLKNWIKTNSPLLSNKEKPKFTYDTIPPYGKMSFPGDSSKLLDMSCGASGRDELGRDYLVRLLNLRRAEDSDYNIYLAIKFTYNEKGITEIKSTEYSTPTGWTNLIWKPLTQTEVNTLYFIDKKGNPIWIANLMS
jgi:hypothetical protein